VGHAGNEIDEVWQQISQLRGVVARGEGVMYPTTQNGDLCLRESLWRAKILKGVKEFLTLFSKVVSSISMKFSMIVALWWSSP